MCTVTQPPPPPYQGQPPQYGQQTPFPGQPPQSPAPPPWYAGAAPPPPPRRRVLGGYAPVVATVVALAAVAVGAVVLTTGGEDSAGGGGSAQTSGSATGDTGGTGADGPPPSRTPPPRAAREPRSTSGPCHYAETEVTLAAHETFDVGLPPDPDPTPATGTVPVTLRTSVGDVVVTLDRAAAPCAVQSFTYLAGKGFFDDTTCHRLTTAGIYVLQCGDPTATGMGGPTYQFGDENLDRASYGDGVVAMANAGPGTNGSQFFVVYRDSSSALQKNYTVIGRVTSGLDALRAVGGAGADDANGPGDGHPRTPVVIRSVDG
jgi:peptidyl-prolyl cis-trans isomerase B (cyclophilin B)